MDRRAFIKLTAVTGGATAIAACSSGSPENELIRFVPDEDLTPGIAEIKNGVCPICRAGCGTTVRVMQGDAEVVRNGQRGVTTMSLAKKLEGNATHPVSQGHCVRAARRRSRSRITPTASGSPSSVAAPAATTSRFHGTTRSRSSWIISTDWLARAPRASLG